MNSNFILVDTKQPTQLDLNALGDSFITVPGAWVDRMDDEAPNRHVLMVIHSVSHELQLQAAHEVYNGLAAATEWSLELLDARTDETIAKNF